MTQDAASRAARVPSVIIFGPCLKLALASRDMNADELAKKADMPASHISHFLCDRRVPTLNSLLRLCRALEMTPNELLMISPMRFRKVHPPMWIPTGEDV